MRTWESFSREFDEFLTTSESHHCNAGRSFFCNGVDVASDALGAVKTLKDWCQSEDNGPCIMSFVSELVQDLMGTLRSEETIGKTGIKHEIRMNTIALCM